MYQPLGSQKLAGQGVGSQYQKLNPFLVPRQIIILPGLFICRSICIKIIKLQLEIQT